MGYIGVRSKAAKYPIYQPSKHCRIDKRARQCQSGRREVQVYRFRDQALIQINKGLLNLRIYQCGPIFHGLVASPRLVGSSFPLLHFICFGLDATKKGIVQTPVVPNSVSHPIKSVRRGSVWVISWVGLASSDGKRAFTSHRRCSRQSICCLSVYTLQ